MAFCLVANEAVESGIRRIVCEQIEKAIAEATNGRVNRHEAIHQVRKRCKKIRAVLRLVRPALRNGYRTENARFRDAAREFSSVRDAAVMIETLRALRKLGGRSADTRAFASVEQALLLRKHAIEAEINLNQRFERFVNSIRRAEQAAKSWELAANGFEAIEDGLTKTFHLGRTAMKCAYAERDDTAFHEWRKRAKDHRYHMRLLSGLNSAMMKGPLKEIHQLSDLLGEDHNLAVLHQLLRSRPDKPGRERDRNALFSLIDHRRDELKALAKPIGARVYAEKPKWFRSRLGIYWNATMNGYTKFAH